MQSVALALEAASKRDENAAWGSDVMLVKIRAQSVFFRAMSSWRLTERQISTLVRQGHEQGDKNRLALFVFDDQLRPNELQIFGQIAEILEVFLVCRQVFASDAAGALWLKSPSEAPCFCNMAPLTWMIHGGSAGIKQVKEHLQTVSPS